MSAVQNQDTETNRILMLLASQQQQIIDLMARTTGAVTPLDPVQKEMLAQVKLTTQITVQPWQAHVAAFATERTAWKTEDAEDRKTAFVEQAAKGRLTPMEALVGAHLFWGADTVFLEQLLVHKKGQQRITAHNFLIAETMGEVFKNNHGAKLVDFPWPLFPPLGKLKEINSAMLSAYSAELSGGGGKPWLPSDYFAVEDDVAGGEFVAKLEQLPDGTYGTNLTLVEQSYSALCERLAIVEGILARNNWGGRFYQRGGRGGGGGYQGRGNSYRNNRRDKYPRGGGTDRDDRDSAPPPTTSARPAGKSSPSSGN